MSSFSKTFVKSSSAVSKLSGSSQASAKKASAKLELDVEEKLRNLERYRHLGGPELKDEVKSLTNVDTILNTSFSHLVEETLLEELAELDENPDGEFVNPTEVVKAKSRQKRRSIDVALIPLKITVRDLRSNRKAQRLLETVTDIFKHKEFIYGAKHVSLTVGNVVLEWGIENLVVPYWESEQNESSLNSDERDITALSPHNAEATAALELEPRLLPIEDEMKHLFYRTGEKRKVFQRLAEVISQYNRTYYYDVFSRNCQTFVIDALKALGISNKVSIKVEESERMQQLRVRKSGEIPDIFSKHEDLDIFIGEKSQEWLDKLDPESLEYLQLVYSQFHGDNTGCHVTGCRLNMVAHPGV
ncbi:uncharacterized protein LOC135335442 [Halichondria panicea]|uniref:uncharacterized protein LOC135335442 n=1 Tax=Halichondria panicea TaxID=6063 RepID=UPI00312B87FB